MPPLRAGVPLSPAALTAAIKPRRSATVAPANIVMAAVGGRAGLVTRMTMEKLTAKTSPPAARANQDRADLRGLGFAGRDGGPGFVLGGRRRGRFISAPPHSMADRIGGGSSRSIGPLTGRILTAARYRPADGPSSKSQLSREGRYSRPSESIASRSCGPRAAELSRFICHDRAAP